MKQIPVFLAFFLAGAGVAAFAFWAFQPKTAEDISGTEFAREAEPTSEETSTPGGTDSPGPVAPADERETPAAVGDASKGGPGTSAPAGGKPKDTASPAAPAPAALPSAGAGALPVVRGTVTYGADGAGLPGIPVRVLREGNWHAECLTDRQGNFALGVPGPGQWRVAAFPFGDGGLQPGEDLTLAAGESRYISIVIPSQLTLDITGKVTDDGGRPVADVKVNAYLPVGGGRGDRKKAVTDASGSYAIRGLTVTLEKPTPQAPREVNARGGFPRRFGGFFRSSLSVRFQHPDYGQESKNAQLGGNTDGRVTVNATLRRPGWVSGTVVFPDGKTPKRGYLTYTIEMGMGGSSGSGVRLEGNKFRIPIKQKGRLILGEKLGDYRVLDCDLGEVSRNTRKSGVVVRLEVMQYHDLAIVNEAGQPLGENVRIFAYFDRRMGHHFDDLDSSGSKLRIPVPLKEAAVLVISAEGMEDARVKLEPGNLPSSVTMKSLAPLMTGVVRFPAGFDDWRNVRLRVSAARGSGGTSSTMGGFNSLDEKTGAFTIHRPSGCGEGTVFTVEVTIPGYLPWKKAGIKLEEGETLRNVEITFKK